MTSRERLLRVLAGKPTDRVPVSTYELVGYNSRSFENRDPSYRPLMDEIRARTDCVCMWDPASNAALPKSDHVSDFLETTAACVDLTLETVRDGDVTTTRRTLRTPRGDLHCVTHVRDGLHTVWKTRHWCRTPEDVDRLLSIPYEPVTYDFDDLPRVRAELGERGILLTSVFDPIAWAADLMSLEDALVWATTETEHFARTVAALHQRVMENLRHLTRDHVADCYRICGPEVATAPHLPPELFERFVLPYDREMVRYLRGRGAFVRIHCHGRMRGVLDSLAALEADALDPCEGPPDGDIGLAEVKRRVGDRLCLFGNLQPRVLEEGDPAAVRAAVAACMSAAKAGGRYVIMPTSAPILSPLPPATEANYRAYIDAALELGTY